MNKKVPPGDYSIRVNKVVGYNQLQVELTAKGPYKGEQFVVKPLVCFLRVTDTTAELIPGKKLYDTRRRRCVASANTVEPTDEA